jgi:hypothetical protein
MIKITGSKIEELTMADLEDQKETLKILSQRDYINCIELNLESDDPYMEFECDDEDRFYDDINEITDDLV